MVTVAALLERRPALLAVRRAFPRSAGLRLVTARSPGHLALLLSRQLVDVIVLGAEPARGHALDGLRHQFPHVPLVLYAPFRSDDAELLLRARRERVAAVAIEGVDDPVLAEIVGRNGQTSRRKADLLPLARRLDLTDPLQLRAWEMIVSLAPQGLDTDGMARKLRMRRETLSRRFAAGGAPTLKRAIDAVRVLAAGTLLGNPGYRVEDVARLLGFSSPSLLHKTSRRIFGLTARQAAALDVPRLVSGLRGDRPGSRWA
jgi:AraC-like DNA-binding protein